MTEFKKFKIGDLFDCAQLGDTNLKKSDLTNTGDIQSIRYLYGH